MKNHGFKKKIKKKYNYLRKIKNKVCTVFYFIMYNQYGANSATRSCKLFLIYTNGGRDK